MNSPPPKGILFDLDDTILAYDSISNEIWQKVCRRFVVKIGGIDAEALFNAINEMRDWYWSDPVRHARGRLNLVMARREVVAMALNKLGVSAPELANELADSYGAEREIAIKPFPGAIDTLEFFQRKGIRLALVTNGAADYQRGKIERFGLTRFFNYILIEGEFGLGKPDTRVFWHTLEQLRITAGEAWMVGNDLEHDIAGAQRAGIFSVWVDWRGQGLPESSSVHPDKVITALPELL